MKSILPIVAALAFMVSPVNAGVQVSLAFGGGGYHGGCFSPSVSRCAFSAGIYNPYRSCGYVGYPGYYYAAYGYPYAGYVANYYPVTYDQVAYVPPTPPAPVPSPAQAPDTSAAAPPASPAPAATPAAPPAQMLFGILDVNGFIHSPYSDAIFKVPGVRNAQVVYDPVTGKPFLVR